MTILGIYSSKNAAEKALDILSEKGIDSKNISVIARETDIYPERANDVGSNVAAGAATGVGTGAVIGGLAGLLVGIGAITLPGIGGLLIGGPLAAALGLTGAAASTVTGATGGAVAGGLLGALAGLGIPKDEAQVYVDRVKEGAVILAASAMDTDSEDVVRQTFESTGADQIRSIR